MKTKILLAALALVAAPSLALAEGCSFGHTKSETASMSCAEGSVYSSEAKGCVPTTS
jgi:hypothetical protein